MAEFQPNGTDDRLPAHSATNGIKGFIERILRQMPREPDGI
jgi:hypothetical protein